MVQIEAKLNALLASAKDKSLQCKAAEGGVGVVLVDSREDEDQDLDCNMNSRDISSNFTAGPKKARFSISFSIVNEEGEETVTIESELFRFEDGECDDIDDHDILEFLTNAGLQDAAPSVTKGGVGVAPAEIECPTERRKWLVAEVITDALEAVIEKHGSESSLGVSLLGPSLNAECAYGWLGLAY